MPEYWPNPRPDPSKSVREAETARTRARYDRLARSYDRIEGGIESRRFQHWRRILWDRVRGACVLEVGVGTGKNIVYYPPHASVTGIDLSPKMLERAKQEAARRASPVTLRLADAQRLPFPDESFDAVVATFVFCSVPDPVRGLCEARRVFKPGGQLVLLEHVLSTHRLIRPLMRIANPLVVRLMGANINRETVRNVERAGFQVRRVEYLMRHRHTGRGLQT